MSRIATVCVVVMILLAGCAGGGSPADNGDENGAEEENGLVTYTNETENSTVTMVADHSEETYDLTANGTVSATDQLTRDLTIGIYCELAHDTVYNQTNAEVDLIGNTTFTKTTESGDTETVDGLPEEVFDNYDPNNLQANSHAENGTVLDTCTVEGEEEYTHS